MLQETVSKHQEMSWKDSGVSENANVAIPMQAFMDLSEKNWSIVRYGISHLYPMPS